MSKRSISENVAHYHNFLDGERSRITFNFLILYSFLFFLTYLAKKIHDKDFPSFFCQIVLVIGNIAQKHFFSSNYFGHSQESNKTTSISRIFWLKYFPDFSRQIVESVIKFPHFLTQKFHHFMEINNHRI